MGMQPAIPGVLCATGMGPAMASKPPRSSATRARRCFSRAVLLKCAASRKNRHDHSHERLSFLQPNVVKMTKRFHISPIEQLRHRADAFQSHGRNWLERARHPLPDDSRHVSRFIE